MASSCVRNVQVGPLQVGPWGGNGGAPWTFKQDGRITEICIHSGDAIDSISFRYKDDKGTRYSPKYGGEGGTELAIVFEEDEELNQMSGTTGEYMGTTAVTSLIFVTNKKGYGPFGTDGGTSFSLPVASGKFVGFFGTGGPFIRSIGANLQY